MLQDELQMTVLKIFFVTFSLSEVFVVRMYFTCVSDVKHSV